MIFTCLISGVKRVLFTNTENETHLLNGFLDDCLNYKLPELGKKIVEDHDSYNEPIPSTKEVSYIFPLIA